MENAFAGNNTYAPSYSNGIGGYMGYDVVGFYGEKIMAVRVE